MTTRKIQYGPSDPLPDESIYNTLLSFKKVKDATVGLRDESGKMVNGLDEIGKLTIHLETLAKRESKWLLAAFELLNNRPELSIMLGGSGLEQVRVLAKMLKQEADRVYIRDLLENPSKQVLRQLGPFGLGPSVAMNTRGSELVYDPSGNVTDKRTTSLFNGGAFYDMGALYSTKVDNKTVMNQIYI
ncbi:hypothetical protein RFI_32308 [Reticulomyxa filosa]|uniref:Uncharacterized protein n=1 Tax=Reticulomyxa filosa TaxID=46433 RepID=X6LT31_RETFI|nr:hypothetical protein RFI_32308 [Reticulomyxa filosa]|eukprot:ETO05088.1 hypothetical protein RFI_32308 [Reticulomyxa filosa]